MSELCPLRNPQCDVLYEHLDCVVAALALLRHEVLDEVQRVLADDGQPPRRDVGGTPRRHEDAGQKVLQGELSSVNQIIN